MGKVLGRARLEAATKEGCRTCPEAMIGEPMVLGASGHCILLRLSRPGSSKVEGKSDKISLSSQITLSIKVARRLKLNAQQARQATSDKLRAPKIAIANRCDFLSRAPLLPAKPQWGCSFAEKSQTASQSLATFHCKEKSQWESRFGGPNNRSEYFPSRQNMAIASKKALSIKAKALPP